MWKEYIELCKHYWHFSIKYGWVMILIVLGIWVLCWLILKIKIGLETKMELMLKILNCIKVHLCKQDEDYDKPIISPKFLSDALDQMAIDGFEV
jgi:hypothetical protein